MDSGLQAGLVEQGPVQGAAVGTMKRKKLRRNPVRKARLHCVDLAKGEAQQPNRLRPFFSALETFFFAGLSEWNLKKIWINSKKLQPIPEWFWMALLVRSHRPPPVPLLNILQNSFNTY